MKLSPEKFHQIFQLKQGFQNLEHFALQSNLSSTQNRFTCWKIFLNILDQSSSLQDWINQTLRLRESYYKLQQSQRNMNTQDLDPVIFNPLSPALEVLNIQNPWNSYFQDNQLKDNIRTDVIRTYQQIELFREEEVQKTMVNILFTWAKANEELSYKQAMNQVLAPIVYVAYSEKADMFDIPAQSQTYLQVLNSPKSIQPDCYWVFKNIMDRQIKQLFYPVITRQINSKAADLFQWEAEQNELVNQDKSNQDVSAVLRRSHRIHHRLLKELDPQLYYHLQKHKVQPQMYLQRWLRCILTREFDLQRSLILWDAIFAQKSREFVLLDFLCVSMIVFVRDTCNLYTVLQSDATGILRRLLRFPEVEDVQVLISMALDLKSQIFGMPEKRAKSRIEQLEIPRPHNRSVSQPDMDSPDDPIIQKVSSSITILQKQLEQENIEDDQIDLVVQKLKELKYFFITEIAKITDPIPDPLRRFG